MANVYGYARVSTHEQDTENQRLEMKQAGYPIKPRYWYADKGVSGAVHASQRPQFGKLLDPDGRILGEGDSLVVTKIDRLGRDAIDVQQTVKALAARGVRVFVTQLGTTDLTSSAGKMLLAMLSAVAEMERDLLVERTQAGLARARAEGKVLGRPSKTTEAQRSAIRAAVSEGKTRSELAKLYGISRATVIAISRTVSA